MFSLLEMGYIYNNATNILYFTFIGFELEFSIKDG
jgi:hypothetical protein